MIQPVCNPKYMLLQHKTIPIIDPTNNARHDACGSLSTGIMLHSYSGKSLPLRTAPSSFSLSHKYVA